MELNSKTKFKTATASHVVFFIPYSLKIGTSVMGYPACHELERRFPCPAMWAALAA